MNEEEIAQTGAEVVPEVEVKAEAGSEATTEQPETPKAEQPRDEKGKFVPQERVNEITRARREAERERDALRHELEQARANQPAPQAQSADVPKLEDFQFDLGKWGRAVADHARNAARQEFQSREVQHTQQQVFRAYAERAQEYSKTAPTFNDDVAALDRVVNYHPAVVDAIASSEYGPQVTHYLSQHLDEADRLARLPPHLAAVQIGRLEAQVSAPKPKPVTNAPNPVPTVGGGSHSSKDPDRMSDAEFSAWRRRQIAQRG
jgi:hypothetical protein